MKPFKHIVIDDYVTPERARAVSREFPVLEHACWRRYEDPRETKLACETLSMLGTATRSTLTAMLELDVKVLLDLEGHIEPDFDLRGGGMHLIEPGGRLGMHTDFTVHPDGRYLRANAILFIGDPGLEGGDLLLGKDQDVRIKPAPGKLVLFETSTESWHGHPEPVTKGLRKSLACYFYSTTPSDTTEHHSTRFL